MVRPSSSSVGRAAFYSEPGRGRSNDGPSKNENVVLSKMMRFRANANRRKATPTNNNNNNNNNNTHNNAHTSGRRAARRRASGDVDGDREGVVRPIDPSTSSSSSSYVERRRRRPRIPERFLSSAADTSRRRSGDGDAVVARKYAGEVCSFCGSTNAAVLVKGGGLGTTVLKPLCLLHVLTTRAVSRTTADPRRAVEIPTPAVVGRSVAADEATELSRQLPAMNDLFAEAFAELRREIAEETTTTHSNNNDDDDDPLSILDPGFGSFGSKPRTRTKKRNRRTSSSSNEPRSRSATKTTTTTTKKKGTSSASSSSAPPRRWREEEEEEEGGFVRDLKLPRNIVEHQRRQERLSMGLAASEGKGSNVRTSTTTTTTTTPVDLDLGAPSLSKLRRDLAERGRKRSRKANVATTTTTTTTTTSSVFGTKESSRKGDDGDEKKLVTWDDVLERSRGLAGDVAGAGVECAGCGGRRVENASGGGGHGASGGVDTVKGETWGSKDRTIVVRWRCLECGKTWHEDD